MTNFGDLMSCFFERYIQKCTLYHVLILIMTSQIWQIMGSLRIQKLEYLENRTYLFYETKKFLACASDGTYGEAIVFVAEVNFNKFWREV